MPFLLPLLPSQGIGVRRAPPRDSSEPRLAWGVVDGVPHDTDKGSGEPFERTVEDEGSGIAGGSGKMCAPEETWMTRSTAWRYEGRVR